MGEFSQHRHRSIRDWIGFFSSWLCVVPASQQRLSERYSTCMIQNSELTWDWLPLSLETKKIQSVPSAGPGNQAPTTVTTMANPQGGRIAATSWAKQPLKSLYFKELNMLVLCPNPWIYPYRGTPIRILATSFFLHKKFDFLFEVKK